MSMNLYLRVDGKEVNLLQTPTQISYMCTSSSEGFHVFECTGNKAKRAINSYLAWIKYSDNGVWRGTKEDFYEHTNLLNQHIKDIQEIVNKGKEIEVYIL